MEIRIKAFLEFILPATMVSNLASLFFSGVKGSLRDPKVDLKLAVFLSCLGITVLGFPPLSEETPGIIAIVGIGGVRQ